MNKPGTFTTQEWVTKARIDIMRDPVFCAFCAVLSCGDLTLDRDIPTACTDGWNIRINPDFADKLTLPELRFVLIHEGMHIAFQHLHVWRDLWKRDAQGTNVAADMFINLAIVQADGHRGFVSMPDIGIKPDVQYADMSVQQIYDRMKQNPPPPQGGGSGEGQSGIDDHDWEGAAQQSPAEQAERAEKVAQAVRQGEIVRQRTNKGSGTSAGVFGALLAPSVDWKQALRQFFTDQCSGQDDSSWRKLNRRYIASDVYMPAMVGEQIGEVVIGFDTSGSCFGTAEMTRFVTEVRTLIEETCPAKCHVVYWDTQVVGHQEFSDGQFAVASLQPRGGGGTNGAVLFDYLREKKINPVAVVQLTDGDVGNWGKSDWPTLWAVTKKRNRAPYGTTIHLQ